jgi:Ca-activated chloride channel family protein
MKPPTALLLMVGTLLAAGSASFSQTSTPESVRILSPTDGSYVAGPTLLRARVDPATAAQSLIFFVDGRQVCVLVRTPHECDWDAGAAVEEHQIRLVATFADGRRVVKTVRTKGVGFAESVDVDAVQVTATVMDRGHYVTGLTRAAFHVSEDGHPQTISHFESEDVPLELVVALDISGSMTLAIPKLKQAAKEFVRAVSTKDRVTVLGFNDNIFTLARRSSDPTERAEGIDQLAAWGATALYDVIITGVDTLGRQSGRKALIVFTDGEDQGSHARIEDVEQRLQASDLTLYMIGQGRGTSLESLKKIMRRLSEPTGGRALFTEKIEELHDSFAELLDELSNQYLLSYAPTNTKRDGALRHIKVEVDGHRAVRAREAYRLSLVPNK